MKKLKNTNLSILSIDTTEFGKVIFGLAQSHPKLVLGSKSNIITKTFNVTPRESGQVIIFLEKFLKSAKIKNLQSTISQIIVYKNSKSAWSGLRVAKTIADALGLAWQVPIKVMVKY